LISFNKADLAPAKYKNSGFVNPGKKVKKEHEKMDLGGLNDEDIEQDRPEFEDKNENNAHRVSSDVEVPAGLQRDTTRRNTVCFRFNVYYCLLTTFFRPLLHLCELIK
jgi:hypothetical protein